MRIAIEGCVSLALLPDNYTLSKNKILGTWDPSCNICLYQKVMRDSELAWH